MLLLDFMTAKKKVLLQAPTVSTPCGIYHAG